MLSQPGGLTATDFSPFDDGYLTTKQRSLGIEFMVSCRQNGWVTLCHEHQVTSSSIACLLLFPPVPFVPLLIEFMHRDVWYICVYCVCVCCFLLVLPRGKCSPDILGGKAPLAEDTNKEPPPPFSFRPGEECFQKKRPPLAAPINLSIEARAEINSRRTPQVSEFIRRDPGGCTMARKRRSSALNCRHLTTSGSHISEVSPRG